MVDSLWVTQEAQARQLSHSCQALDAEVAALRWVQHRLIKTNRFDTQAVCRCYRMLLRTFQQHLDEGVDVKGNSVHVKGNSMDVKSNGVGVKGNRVGVKGNRVDVKGNRVGVKDNGVDVKGNGVDVKGN
eukprot:9492169-Pyramimonas_sp.AAC.2